MNYWVKMFLRASLGWERRLTHWAWCHVARAIRVCRSFLYLHSLSWQPHPDLKLNTPYTQMTLKFISSQLPEIQTHISNSVSFFACPISTAIFKKKKFICSSHNSTYKTKSSLLMHLAKILWNILWLLFSGR